MFSLCGGDAFCVAGAENYGVVCLISNAVKCVTCRFGGKSCVYVDQVKVLVNSEEPLSELLHKFAKAFTMESPKMRSSVQPAFQ